MFSLQKTRGNNLFHTQRSLEKTILHPYIRREHVFTRRDDPVQVYSSFSSMLEFSLRTLCEYYYYYCYYYYYYYYDDDDYDDDDDCFCERFEPMSHF